MLKETLCWSCKNAVPDMEGKRGCSWSRKLEPVEGWETIETKRKTKLFAKGTYYYVEDEAIGRVYCPDDGTWARLVKSIYGGMVHG